MNINPADSDIVDIFAKEVSIILNTLGHPEAFVTDDSTIADFLPQLPSKMLVSTIPLLELIEMKRQGRQMDEFMKPVEYTVEDELETQSEIDSILSAISLLFMEYNVNINPNLKICDLARILNNGNNITVH